MLDLVVKVRGQREKGEEVEGELQRQLSRLKGEVGDFLGSFAGFNVVLVQFLGQYGLVVLVSTLLSCLLGRVSY